MQEVAVDKRVGSSPDPALKSAKSGYCRRARKGRAKKGWGVGYEGSLRFSQITQVGTQSRRNNDPRVSIRQVALVPAMCTRSGQHIFFPGARVRPKPLAAQQQGGGHGTRTRSARESA